MQTLYRLAQGSGLVRWFLIDVVDGVGALGRNRGSHVRRDSLGNVLSIELIRGAVERGRVTVVVELVEGNAVAAP